MFYNSVKNMHFNVANVKVKDATKKKCKPKYFRPAINLKKDVNNGWKIIKTIYSPRNRLQLEE